MKITSLSKMGKITSLSVQKNNKNRVNVFVDEEFYIGLSLESVYKYSLKVGQEIDIERIEAIISESEKADAINKATVYISKTIKTKRQVKDYIVKKGYSEELAYQVVDKLKEYGYIDDKEYSKRYLESTNKTQGIRLAEFKLMSKGVKKEDIETAMNNSEIEYEKSAKALAEKHLRNKEITKENLMKTYRYLIGRGFTYEQADYALKEFKENL